MPQKCGDSWMYHTKGGFCSDSKPAPPLSSIPLIGLQEEDPKEPVQIRPFSNLRSTDTPLIRLQKMGGRKDLLCFHENERRKDSVEVPLERVSDSPRKNMPSCSDDLFEVPANVRHSACISKLPAHPPSKIVDSPCLPPPATGHRRQKRIKPWNQLSSRSRYSNYNRIVPPLSFMQRESFYPHSVRYVRHDLPSQPDCLANLLAHKYAEEDYRMQKELWNDYLEQLKDSSCCQPRAVKVVTSRFNPIPKRW